MTQGRLEADERIKEHIEEQLKNRPYYLSAWFLNMQANSMTMKTCYTYLNKVNYFLDFIKAQKQTLSVDLDSISLADLSAFFVYIQFRIDNNGRKIKTSDDYRLSVWYALNRFFNYCVANGDCRKNLMSEVKPKDRDKEKKYKKPLLTADDFSKMLMYAPGKGEVKKRNKAILLLYMTTGMRKDALCQINIEDIDFETGALVVVDKGEKEHTYKLQEGTIRAINDWLEIRNDYAKTNSDALFISNQGVRISNSAITKIVNIASEQGLGQRISPHRLRSGYCSILYKETHDLEFVRKSVGHDSYNTTKRYIVTDNNESSKASNIMEKALNLT